MFAGWALHWEFFRAQTGATRRAAVVEIGPESFWFISLFRPGARMESPAEVSIVIVLTRTILCLKLAHLPFLCIEENADTDAIGRGSAFCLPQGGMRGGGIVLDFKGTRVRVGP